MTGLIDKSDKAQFLDKLKVEQERGITVKAQTVTLRAVLEAQEEHGVEAGEYIFNLIDTPGHVDFAYEVS